MGLGGGNGGILGLVGLLAGLAATLWLVVTALFRGPRAWVARIAVLGLALFAVSTVLSTRDHGRVIVPVKVTTVVATPHLRQEALPSELAKVVRPQCSLPPVFPGDLAKEFHDGSTRYSLMAVESYPEVANTDSKAWKVWVILGMENLRTTPVRSDPWFDFWLLPLPPEVHVPHPPHPIRVDVLEIGGPALVPIGEILLLDPGLSCSLTLTFRLPSQPERAALFIGYAYAFTLDLNPE